MNNTGKSIVRALLVLTISLFLASCQGTEQIGQVAPDFSLRDINGRMASLGDHRGKVRLLDFWAVWCPPCRLSIPELVGLQAKYRDKGLVILGISLDDPRQLPDKHLRAFRKMAKINYEILRYDQKVLKDYFGNESPAVPTMFLVDRDGKIRDKFVGFVPGAVEKSLKGLL